MISYDHLIPLPSPAMTRLPASAAVEVWSAFLGRFDSFNRVLSWLGACILSFFQNHVFAGGRIPAALYPP